MFENGTGWGNLKNTPLNLLLYLTTESWTQGCCIISSADNLSSGSTWNNKFFLNVQKYKIVYHIIGSKYTLPAWDPTQFRIWKQNLEYWRGSSGFQKLKLEENRLWSDIQTEITTLYKLFKDAYNSIKLLNSNNQWHFFFFSQNIKYVKNNFCLNFWVTITFHWQKAPKKFFKIFLPDFKMF